MDGIGWNRANLIQMTIISTTVGKNPLDGVALIVNRRVQNAVFGTVSKTAE